MLPRRMVFAGLNKSGEHSRNKQVVVPHCLAVALSREVPNEPMRGGLDPGGGHLGESEASAA